MKDRRREGAGFLALVSGALLLAGHFSGAAQWEALLALLDRFVDLTPPVRLLFLAVLAVASLGGVAVLAGGVLILEERLLLGRLLILLGTGVGLLSFLLFLGPALLEGSLLALGSSGVVAVGIGLSIAARWRARG